MLDNNIKSKKVIKKETMYTNYLKMKEAQTFVLKSNIISDELKEKLVTTLQKKNQETQLEATL